ncbi:basal-body rod modification protein FlgD [Klebsiella sp. WP7-S18-CRE-02]|uniref:Basal-body rod modification protein FlgD n=1 Tax=Kluyvera genomosp. 2 TaxID=2774054 RepID=A0A2T2Y572_9ENTR|nr:MULTISPECIES: flagellar hook assembly protein FlgD [Enterobacteriaceae]HAT3916958.1 flagellar hook assembly protein FlgD [Kluyvera ascorbata]PSR47684.1 flagellar basal body rod modification protein [Kluyvera genomosp. 2]BBQ81579.1 basal-body rod modification protein FlgD [Klebsiella sp. WP3-W18-ESBL-02]BBR18628.1 basal-body rod modification protein FlgD [Klebsiella sp. WP3-S18-ESBL-05]BBR56745.1 basal-body rod modification protein FlgD [Klebsiella sp. WP4-W18-ESBL-05]
MNVDSAYTDSRASSSTDGVVSSNTASGMNTMFMQLLVAQIQNQDPLNPTDGTEYVSQLAQLTQVQSMETMSQLMANSSVLMDNLQTLTTGNLVGQHVMVQTGSIESDGETVLDGRLTLEHAANVVTVIVKDSAGVEHKIELGKQEAGQVDFTIDPEELGLSEGKYTLSVVTDTGEENVPIEVGGVVSNVRIPLDGSSTVLNINGLGEIAYNNITQFGTTAKNTA